MDEQVPEIPVGTHYVEQDYLYAFASQGEILNYVRTQATDSDRERLPEIMTAWQNVQPRVSQISDQEAGIAETISVAPIPEEHTAAVESYVSTPLFQRTFSSLPVTIGVVEIDKLVAGQRMVNLPYVERLTERYASSPTFETLLDVCVSPHREMAPIQHLEIAPNTHVFSSPNSDIRFLGAFAKRQLTSEDLDLAEAGGLPGIAVVAFVGYGGASVNVLAASLPSGVRYVLNNGFHRVYALRRAGVTHIPVVIQQVQNVQLEFPPQVGQLPREYLLAAPRPSLMKDFFEPDFTVALKVLDRIKMVTIAIALNQHEVPS
jgi:hypothetical protein